MSASSLWELLWALGLVKSSASHWKEELLFFCGILVLGGRIFSFRLRLTWLLWICHQKKSFFYHSFHIFSQVDAVLQNSTISLFVPNSLLLVEMLAWGSAKLFRYWALTPLIFLWLKAWFFEGNFFCQGNLDWQLQRCKDSKVKSRETKPKQTKPGKNTWTCFHRTSQDGFV